MTYFRCLSLAASLFAFSFLAGCGSANNSSSSYDTTTAEVIGESIGGAASESDPSGGSVVSMLSPALQKLPLSSKIKLLAHETFESTAQANVCSTQAALTSGSCSGGAFTINLSSCTGLLGTWTGAFTATFSPTSVCTDVTTGGLAGLPSGDTMTLTASAGITMTTNTDYSVTTSSSSSGYATTEAGGTVISCAGAGCTPRTVNIQGIHRILMGPGGLTPLFDHTLNTPTPFSISGVGAAKTITAGTLQLQHNLLQYTASSQITQALTFTSGCCFPTGGQVTTTFTAGSKTGSETLTFGPSCGVGSVGGTTVTFLYCQ